MAFNVPFNFNPKIAASLDSRLVVNTKSDLFKLETWPYDGNVAYIYNGMVVAVTDTNSLYMLVDKTRYTEESAWQQMDAAAALVADDTNTDSATTAFSARQGKLLREDVTVLQSDVSTLKTKVTTVYDYRGTKQNLTELNALTKVEKQKGFVYNVIDAVIDEAGHEVAPPGTNYAWDGEKWDALGGKVDLSGYVSYTSDVNRIAKIDNGITFDGGETTAISKNSDGSLSIGGGNRVYINGPQGQDLVYNGDSVITRSKLNKEVLSLNNSIDTINSSIGDIEKAIGLSKTDIEKVADDLLSADLKLQGLITDTSSHLYDTSTYVDSIKPFVVREDDHVVTDITDYTYAGDKVTLNTKAIHKDADTSSNGFNNTQNHTLELKAATTTEAGVMTAADRNDLNTIKGDVSTAGSMREIAQSTFNNNFVWVVIGEDDTENNF